MMIIEDKNKNFCMMDTEIDINTLCRCTEYKDVDGNNIYENDHVTADWEYGEINYGYQIVDFNDIIFADSECVLSDNIKIVGNKFE